jgi:ferrochelatase
MREDGIERALAFVTSAFGSYSGCRQYIENIRDSGAPVVAKIPPFSSHPKFLEAMIERTRAACAELPQARLLFTAHSVPVAMAKSSPYVQELEHASAAVAAAAGRAEWKLVYQSRSGPPGQPWLEPDICDELRQSRSDAVIVPIGFLSDHMEVIYDLDTEARALCEALGIRMVRAGTVGTHPAIIRMIAELIEREPEACGITCCPAPQRPVIKR